MSSKKGLSSKRTTLPRASDHTQAFTKDWTRLSHSGHFDLKRLKEAMLLLIANDGALGPEYVDHSLGANLGRPYIVIFLLLVRLSQILHGAEQRPQLSAAIIAPRNRLQSPRQ